ncbi:MAG: hypothetical protein K8T10_22060 [Candidatus Eremiobacteraeota bacterium]|nr:hypothetical protein [Candidatus Eremiobacteraeota bacterium]
MNINLNIDDDKLLEMINAAMEEDMGPVPTSHRHKTPECLSFGRFEQYHLNPALLTEEEKKHIESGCRYCKMNIGLFGEEVLHYSLIKLLLYEYDPGLIKDEIERQNISRHLEINECVKCNALVKKYASFIEGLKELNRTMVIIGENFIMGLSGVRPSFVKSMDPAECGSFEFASEDAEENRFHLDKVSIEQLFDEPVIFKIDVMERPDDQVHFYIETDNPVVMKKPIRFTLSNGEMEKKGFIMLREGMNRFLGQYFVGMKKDFAPFIKKADKFQIILEPLSITSEDDELLIRAVKYARTYGPGSLKSWKEWLEKKKEKFSNDEEMLDFLDEALEVVDDAIRDQGL